MLWEFDVLAEGGRGALLDPIGRTRVGAAQLLTLVLCTGSPTPRS